LVLNTQEKTKSALPPFIREVEGGHRVTITPSGKVLNVHMVWTQEASQFTELHNITLESLFLHHPYAHVTIHSNTLSFKQFERLLARGFNLSIKPLVLNEIFGSSPLLGNMTTSFISQQKCLNGHLL
jgi:hypothetical protein